MVIIKRGHIILSIVIALFVAVDVFLGYKWYSIQNATKQVREQIEATQQAQQTQNEENKLNSIRQLMEEQFANSDHVHTWENGVCTSCGARCQHVHHALDGTCPDCGERAKHRYNGGFCSCGKELVFYDDMLPEEYYQPCEQQGKVESFTINGALDSDTWAIKQIVVYTPCGYDPAKQYDVLFLEGGLGNKCNACVSAVWGYNGFTFSMRDIFDNMIMRGDCAPLIVVGIDGYSKKETSERDLDGYEQSAYFLRYYTYPFIINNYGTYAASANEEDVQAARSHFGIGGLSNGGYLAYWGGMRTILDICSNFLPVAGSIRAHQTAEKVNAQAEYYRIDVLYSGAGLSDTAAYDQTLGDYQILRDNITYLFEGENCFWCEPPYGHDWITMSIVTYNALQVMFVNTL